MRLFAVATGALAALTLVGGAPASAADLGYGYPAPDRYKSAYEDTRYRDIFGPPPGRVTERYVEKKVEERYVDDDDDDAYDRDGYDDKRIITERRYSYAEPVVPSCAPRAAIRDRLYGEGWHDFREVDVRRRVSVVDARRPNGLLYRLSIDRCSGDVVSAHPLGPVVAGPYVYGPRRHGPPFFR